MGYVVPTKISDELTIVASDGECSFHINTDAGPEDTGDTKIIRLTDEQFKVLFGCWLSEVERSNYDGSKEKFINDIAVYTMRVTSLEMLLSDAQFLLEQTEQRTTDQEMLAELREWQQEYRRLHN